MIDLLTLFANNILPIFLAAGSGYLLSKYLKVIPRTISQVGFYIFSPCLVFMLLTNSHAIKDVIFFPLTRHEDHVPAEKKKTESAEK